MDTSRKIDTDPLRTIDEVAQWSGFSSYALAQMRFRGTGPRFVKLGPKAVRYRQSDLDAWVEAGLRQRTDDRPPAA